MHRFHVFFYVYINGLHYLPHAAAVDATDSDPCPSYVSLGDQSVGITAYYDDLCVTNGGGLGCFANFCRFCKTYDTTQSAKFFTCPSASPKVKEMTSTDCATFVSQGDQNVGISAYFESQCTFTSLGGCFPNSSPCRFCRTSVTLQSAHFVDCATSTATGPLLNPTVPILPPASTSAPITSATAPVTATLPPPVNPTSTPAPAGPTCDGAVASSGMTSIYYTINSACNIMQPKITGCVPSTNCQLCRQSKNEGNQYLISCKVLSTSNNESSSVTLTAKTSSGQNKLNEQSISDTKLSNASESFQKGTSNATPQNITVRSATQKTSNTVPTAAVMAGVVAVAAVGAGVRHRVLKKDETTHDADEIRGGSFVEVHQAPTPTGTVVM